MENRKSNSNLKAVIAVLAFLLVGSLVYIFKLSSDVQNVQTELKTTESEKDSVIKDLQELKATYDAAIAENTSMSEELIKERDKVVTLMSDVNRSKGDVSKYKAQYATLHTNMKVLIAENDVLKKQNSKLTIQRDSTVVVLQESKKYNDVLSGKNEELSKVVEKGSKLTILDLKTSAFDLKTKNFFRNKEKVIATDKASKADMLTISFTIAENQIAKPGDKTYYIQIIDTKSNVLGEKKTEFFGDKSLTYSFTTKIKYENKTVKVSQDLPAKEFVKGTYFVNVFDKDVLVSKSSFELQ